MLININKKNTSNKTKDVEAENKITDLTNTVVQISEKGYDFLLGRMCFTGNNRYQDFLVFTPMLSSLILDSNRKVTNWILTATSSEKIKPFNTGLEMMSNLANVQASIR